MTIVVSIPKRGINNKQNKKVSKNQNGQLLNNRYLRPLYGTKGADDFQRSRSDQLQQVHFRILLI